MKHFSAAQTKSSSQVLQSTLTTTLQPRQGKKLHVKDSVSWCVTETGVRTFVFVHHLCHPIHNTRGCKKSPQAPPCSGVNQKPARCSQGPGSQAIHTCVQTRSLFSRLQPTPTPTPILRYKHDSPPNLHLMPHHANHIHTHTHTHTHTALTLRSELPASPRLPRRLPSSPLDTHTRTHTHAHMALTLWPGLPGPSGPTAPGANSSTHTHKHTHTHTHTSPCAPYLCMPLGVELRLRVVSLLHAHARRLHRLLIGLRHPRVYNTQNTQLTR